MAMVQPVYNQTIIQLGMCKLDLCPISESAFNYRPNMGMNAVLLALFILSLLLHIIQGVWYRTWTFLAAMALGNLSMYLGFTSHACTSSRVHGDKLTNLQLRLSDMLGVS